MKLKKLSSELKRSLFTKLEDIVKKLYLKTDISLPDVAEQTAIKLHTISFLINSEFDCQFTDYINLLRINYFKEKLNDFAWQDLTVEKMTLSSGFKSRTTCYRAFIKHEGMSPSEYVKLHKTVYHISANRQRYNYHLLHFNRKG